MRIADLFCGIGSMHIAANELDMRCVYACDNDVHVRKAYQSHFGVLPDGDIKEVNPASVPDHDILCAGFPWYVTFYIVNISHASTYSQPFSRMGNKRGTNEERGRVVDYAIDILRTKRPRAFILENVRGLLNSNNGEDFKRLQSMIADAGYSFQYQMLRCEDFGIPQTRHRVFMVGMRDGYPAGFQYPRPLGKCPSLSEFLGIDAVKMMSNTVRCSGRKSGVDNAKNWSAYRLKDGSIIEYELEHVIRLQGFPLDFDWGGAPESQRWKMLGNTIPTCMSKAILEAVMKHLGAHPERPAQVLALIPHPPPARTIIERHLERCDRDAATRRQKRQVAVAAAEKVEDDDDSSSSTDDEMPSRPHEKRCTTSLEDDTLTRPSGKIATAKPDEIESDPEEKEPIPPYRKRARDVVDDESCLPCITIRSGTCITLTIPKDCDTEEQRYMLKIIR
jgi:DNA (cytosine-5)-methyltransferase 1